MAISLLTLSIIGGGGCATPPPGAPVPLGQSAVDQFLKSGRDPRYLGITVYGSGAQTRFEFANRVHQDRAATRPFVSPAGDSLPIIEAKTGVESPFHLLLDSSARQSWLLMAACRAMDYRVFAPPTGEYPDHVCSEVPGYAGAGNKVILDMLHLESPIFYVPMASGHAGPLARMEETPEGPLDDKAVKRREKTRTGIHAVMGAAMMRAFAYVRLDFPHREIRFSTHATYQPTSRNGTLAVLPMKDWRGRPAVTLQLNGTPMTAVIDTGGDFGLSLPGPPPALTGNIQLGKQLSIPDAELRSHELLGLPDTFPARLGLRLMKPYIWTLDFKNNRVWIEDPDAAPSLTDEGVESDAGAGSTVPVRYKGVTP